MTVFSGADGSELAEHEGEAGELLGYSTAGAGDVNADGIPDYIAGAPGIGLGGTPPLGRAIVYSGADHSVIHEVTPSQRNFFGSAVSGAGDLDGDGHDDFLVGARQDDEFRGLVNAYSGADGSIMWTAEGLHAGDQFGSAAGAVGDVNGDGVPDVVGRCIRSQRRSRQRLRSVRR